MMNKKGFTISEVIVSFTLVTIILASIVSSTVFYRRKLKEEEVITQLIDFKETITKTIYDDILTKENGKIVHAEKCLFEKNCVNFIDKGGNSHTLKVEEVLESDPENNIKKGVYLVYNSKKYMLPDSDLGDGANRVCDFAGGFIIEYYEENNIELYTVKTSYVHHDLDKQYNIILTFTNYNES